MFRKKISFECYTSESKTRKFEIVSDWCLLSVKNPLNLCGFFPENCKHYFHYKIICYASKELLDYCEICQCSTKTCCINTPRIACIRDE